MTLPAGSLSVWCDECSRRFTVAINDMDSRVCPVCWGVDKTPDVGDAPLTHVEKATTIIVDVNISRFWVLDHRGYSTKKWREMLAEVVDRSVDMYEYVEDVEWEPEDHEIKLSLVVKSA